ncbi:ImmA/IrrE family metallo-endopeptidase [Rhodoferax ferrireducens]|uniref:ImmA/IrrE family metallo-endopeptidase n=1 Tax=Rhodoferax ferrireducens TaxID=192843 RepID=UPI003BB72534
MDASSTRFRLQALRDQSKMTQEQLAKALGFKDRQTLSQIELGERKLGFQEMVRAAEVFGVGVDYFTDPFELAGEGKFSWRQTNANELALSQFEQKAGRWIAAFRHLSKLRGDSIHSSLRRVALTSRSSFEDAIAEGEAIGATLRLGEVPSVRLAEALQEELDTLVLYVDAVSGVSGAACQLDQLNAVLINRNEHPARRAFDLAHELFHLLTWSTMPPKHVESERPADRDDKRVEQLAENFAAGLLMPSKTISALVAGSTPQRGAAIVGWVKDSAAKLGVSGSALKWRLVNTKVITKAEANAIPDELLRANGEDTRVELPAPYSKRFISVLSWGMDEGHVSVRRAAQLLDTSVDDLRDLFAEHGLPAPFDL